MLDAPRASAYANFAAFLSPPKGILMNTDIIQGKWKQLSGQIKQEWGKLTNNDLDVIEGNRDYLVGKLQERYGIARDQACEQVRQFESRL